ncbi:hypothetical protein MHM98_03545 [Psychrobium sp. MM17-31]|uniref:hypothetical protein n=1 Tax=Psychrobium sp. MM17-31 TaxID=2917758 RepID=UPI001EF57E09|nr:hypothetical protein [Psychrobium sp. MM17-31]MCG7530433.1 hypothetical protein [Psychrobium sp. MM17-31]
MKYLSGVGTVVFLCFILVVGYGISQDNSNLKEGYIDGRALKVLIYSYPMINSYFKHDLFTGESFAVVDQRELSDFDISITIRSNTAKLIYLERSSTVESINFQTTLSITDGVIKHGELNKLNLVDE